jgi:TonB family protein
MQTRGETSMAAAFATKVIAQLELDTEQQTALLAYEGLIAGASPQTPVDLDAFRAMSLPRRLDYMADQAAIDVTRLRARADAARRFYALLSADQRKGFDAMISPSRSVLAPSPESDPAPVAANYKLPSHTEPDWLVRPTKEEISRVYPRAAIRNHVAGRALLSCKVDTDGYLSDCTVSEETPKDAGFGNAALEVTGYMRMKPATTYGVPIETSVNVPVAFQF